MIFSIVDGNANGGPEGDSALYGKNGVAWVLRFGGVCTLVRRQHVAFDSLVISDPIGLP